MGALGIPSRSLVERLLAAEASLVERISATEQETIRLKSELVHTRAMIEESARARLPQLNSDIIGEIVKHLDIYPDHLEFTLLPQHLFDLSSTEPLENAWIVKAQLAKLCYVSKSWLYPVRRVLYRVIPGCEKFRINRLQQLIDVLRLNPQFRPYVRVLSSTFQEPEYVDAMAMLPHCMVLVPRGHHKAPSPSLANFGRVHHLTFGNPEWVEATWLQGLRNWHCLESLKLNMDEMAGFAMLTSHSRRVSESDAFVPSLRILVYQGSDGIYVFPTLSHTLHTLVLYGCSEVDPADIRHLFQRHSKSLRRICLNYVELSSPTPDLDDIMPPLEELEILQITSEHHMSPIASEALLLNLPTSLVHLRLSLELSPSVCVQFLLQKPTRIPLTSFLLLDPTWMYEGRGRHEGDEWERVGEIAKEVGVHFEYAPWRDTDGEWYNLASVGRDCAFWFQFGEI